MADYRFPGVLRGTALATVLTLAAITGITGCSRGPATNTAAEKNGPGGPFRLVDTKGRTVTDATLRGKPYAIFFGFTRCPDVCPSTLMRLRQVRDALGPDADKLQVLLVSVDPERDTPDRLEAYVKNFDPSFIGLRPEPAELEKVIKAFHALAVKVPTADGKDYTVDHSATLYVYDRRNQLRLIAQPDIAIDAFASDLRRLAQES